MARVSFAFTRGQLAGARDDEERVPLNMTTGININPFENVPPEHRFTLLPAWVALVYAGTVAALFIDSAAVKKRLSVN